MKATLLTTALILASSFSYAQKQGSITEAQIGEMANRSNAARGFGAGYYTHKENDVIKHAEGGIFCQVTYDNGVLHFRTSPPGVGNSDFNLRSATVKELESTLTEFTRKQTEPLSCRDWKADKTGDLVEFEESILVETMDPDRPIFHSYSKGVCVSQSGERKPFTNSYTCNLRFSAR